jgi:hypothetical protein
MGGKQTKGTIKLAVARHTKYHSKIPTLNLKINKLNEYALMYYGRKQNNVETNLFFCEKVWGEIYGIKNYKKY